MEKISKVFWSMNLTAHPSLVLRPCAQILTKNQLLWLKLFIYDSPSHCGSLMATSKGPISSSLFLSFINQCIPKDYTFWFSTQVKHNEEPHCCQMPTQTSKLDIKDLGVIYCFREFLPSSLQKNKLTSLVNHIIAISPFSFRFWWWNPSTSRVALNCQIPGVILFWTYLWKLLSGKGQWTQRPSFGSVTPLPSHSFLCSSEL